MFIPDIFKLFAVLVACVNRAAAAGKGRVRDPAGGDVSGDVWKSAGAVAWPISFQIVVVLDIVVAQKIHFDFPVLVVMNNKSETLRWVSVSLIGCAVFDLIQRHCCRVFGFFTSSCGIASFQ